MATLPRDTTVSEVLSRLDADGYAIVEGLLDPQVVSRIHAELTALLAVTPHGRNSFEGFRTRRLYALFAKTRSFDGGGGANTTDRPRLGVILEYVASWLRPQENHVLAVPREVARTLPERLQELLGYNIYPPLLGYVDGRHPRRVLGG